MLCNLPQAKGFSPVHLVKDSPIQTDVCDGVKTRGTCQFENRGRMQCSCWVSLAFVISRLCCVFHLWGRC